MEFDFMPKKVDVPLIGPVNQSAVLCFFVVVFLSAICILISWMVKRRWKDEPGRFQAVVEMGVERLRGYCRANGGHAGDELGPWALAMALLISSNCLVEYFAFEPPTADLSMTLTLGLLTFLLINVMGIRHKKLKGRLKHYVQPVAIVAPFKLLGDLALPISLGCRLYGNVLSGVIVMGMLYSVLALSFVLPAALSIYFSLFHALIQTYIFITLTLNFVSEAVE